MGPSQNHPQQNPALQQNYPPVNPQYYPPVNPQYYPPQQQSPAAQQNYPPMNPQYYPPQQQNYPPYQPPQQYLPTVNPYQYPQQNYPSQQGFPTVNPSQYDQQPQDSNLIPNTSNTNEFDQKWFKCYKVALVLAIFMGVVQFGNALSSISRYGGLTFFDPIIMIAALCSIAAVVIQFLAMKDRDLKKAKIALVGFASYDIIMFVLPLVDYFLITRSSGSIFQMFFSIVMGVVFYSALTLIGSFKVYQILNSNEIKSQQDDFQNYYPA